ncbi:hypothetical protein EJB05_36146, partial [Eragrostis curvula]
QDKIKLVPRKVADEESSSAQSIPPPPYITRVATAGPPTLLAQTSCRSTARVTQLRKNRKAAGLSRSACPVLACAEVSERIGSGEEGRVLTRPATSPPRPNEDMTTCF